MLDQDTQEDFSKEREITLKDGQVISLTRDPSYGLISIKFKNGRVPIILSGQYTTFFEADRAIQIYLNSKGKEKD